MANGLKALLQRSGMLVAPGAYDAIGARCIERAGFDAVYMTGAGTAAAAGFPDYGLVTMSEMVANATRMARSIAVPLIADADTGFGNELNVWRTVTEFLQAGVAGIHIEDQGFPKKCGHLENKTVIGQDEFVAKIRAASEARAGTDFVVIARTDARAMLGLDAAIARANAALDAGADLAFVEAPQSLEEMAEVPRRVHGPCLLNMVWGGKTPVIPLAKAEAMGYRVSILPGLLLKEALGAFDAILGALRTEGQHPTPKLNLPVASLFGRLGAGEWDERRARFTPGAMAPETPARAAE